MNKKMVCGVTVDSEVFTEINTYGDYVKSLSDKELADWICANIVRKQWKGTDYLTEAFSKKFNGSEMEVVEEPYCVINNLKCCGCQPVCRSRYYK